jgi:hypothetical protein
MRSISLKKLFPVCMLALVGLQGAVSAAEEDMAQQLLYKALENQYRGRYQANVDWIEDSFTKGRDSLSGLAEFADDLGERRMSLSGPTKSFEYKCMNFGKEQWVTDGSSNRIRRIANRQWKKGVAGTLMTYEDMLKFPMDFLLEYSSCKGMKATDSAYLINMLIKPAYQSFYSRLEVSLSKEPVLLKGITFYGQNDQKLKSMQVDGYKHVAGRYLVSDLSVVDCDSTASLQMCFRNFSFQEMPVAKSDKHPGKGGIFSLFSKLTDIMPKGPEASAREQAEENLDVSN